MNFTRKVDPSLVCEERQLHPCATLQDISNKFGVTKERIRQILKRDGLRTQTTRLDFSKERYVCPRCGGQKNYEAKWCKRCFSEMHWVDVDCDNCGKLKQVRVSRLIAIESGKWAKRGFGYKGHFFCSRQCHGKWLAKTYGWGSPRQFKPEVTTA